MTVMTIRPIPSRTVWSQVCEDLADELCEEANIDHPPVDAVELRRRLGREVAATRSTGRRRHSPHDPSTLCLPARFPHAKSSPGADSAGTAGMEQRQWEAAVELGLSCAGRAFERLDLEPAGAPGELREKTARAIAAALLLPRQWFFRDAKACGGDLTTLKRIYATAGHETILNRLLHLKTLTLISVFQDGTLTRRRGNGRLAPPPLLALEREARAKVAERGEPLVLEGGGVRIQAWAVREPRRSREFLRTTPIGSGSDR